MKAILQLDSSNIYPKIYKERIVKRKRRLINMTVQNKIERARKAVAEISNYTQEQVDKLVYEGA